MVARKAFVSDNAEKLDYTKGERLEKVEPPAGEDREDAGFWIYARTTSGQVGKVDRTNMELQLGPEDITARVARMRTELKDLLPSIKARDASALHGLYAMTASYPQAVDMVYEVYAEDVMPTLCDILRSDDLNTAALAWATLTCYRLVNDPGEVGAAAAGRILEGVDGVVSRLLRRARLHQDGGDAYDKLGRKCTSASCSLLGALARVTTSADVVSPDAISLFIQLLDDKNNALHRLPTNARAYHVPSALAYVSALSLRADTAQALVDAGVIKALENVTAEQDTPAAVNDALGALVLLRRRVFWSRKKHKANKLIAAAGEALGTTVNAAVGSMVKKVGLTPGPPAALLAASPAPAPLTGPDGSNATASRFAVAAEEVMDDEQPAPAVQGGGAMRQKEQELIAEAEEGPAENEEQGAGHVMISYNWRNQGLALKLQEALESAGYNVWIDLDKMGTNVRTHRLRTPTACALLARAPASRTAPTLAYQNRPKPASRRTLFTC